MAPNRYWFAPKVYGFGSGRPLSWEGWAVTFVFVALMIADLTLASAPGRQVGVVLLIATFSAVCAWKTEGGWRWRWGGE